MRFGREGSSFYFNIQRPEGEDFGFFGMVVRFVINVAALAFAQLIVPGFSIESWAALLFGALIFGIINAVVKPVVSFISCPLTCLTLGLFMLVINAAMLGLTSWVAGWFDMAFTVDSFWAAFFGGLVIAVTSTLLSIWADGAILGKRSDW